MIRIKQLMHSGLLVSDLSRSRAFYESIFGLVPNPLRPDFAYPGVWYDIGDCQIHLMQLEDPYAAAARPEHGGQDRHTALYIDNMEHAEQVLRTHGVPYSKSKSGRAALFCRDPDGNTLELTTLSPQSLLMPTDPPPLGLIHVQIDKQRLLLLDGQGTPISGYDISSARKGVGEQSGSECTPRGAHVVCGKFGYGAPVNTVFEQRRATGKIWTPELAAQHPSRDWIVTRILWLSGCQPQVNCFGSVDSRNRFIYIHGTPDDQPVGVPRSHGCIRMRNTDVMVLFDAVLVGTPVFLE